MYSLPTVTLFTPQLFISGRPQDKKADRLNCFLDGCGKKSWKLGLVSVGLVYMSHSTWYRKVTLYITVISGYIWHLAVPWLNCIIFMLPQTTLNYEYFDFSTSFPKSSPCPHQSDLNYLSPSTNVLFLVRLNVSRLDVRFSNVISFPSRKQTQGFKVCPCAQLRDSISGQQLFADKPDCWAGAGSKDRGWAL